MAYCQMCADKEVEISTLRASLAESQERERVLREAVEWAINHAEDSGADSRFTPELRRRAKEGK